jgi:hypothetical protein
MTAATSTHIRLDDGWRIVPVVHITLGNLFVLQTAETSFSGNGYWEDEESWHPMYAAWTEQECRAAFEAFSEGETPAGNEVWP